MELNMAQLCRCALIVACVVPLGCIPPTDLDDSETEGGGSTTAPTPTTTGNPTTPIPEPGSSNDGSTGSDPATTTGEGDSTTSGSTTDVGTSGSSGGDSTSGGDSGSTGTSTGVSAMANVVLNELVHNPVSGEDWIEFYNVGEVEADISGFRFNDEDDYAGAFVIPEGTLVEPGGYVVFVRDAPDSFGFGFSSDEEAWFYDDEGNVIETTDWTEGDAAEPSSWGRLPNGTGAFQTLATPSFGAGNFDGIPPAIVINEVVHDPDSGEDWIEFYNPGEAPLNVGDYAFSPDAASAVGGFIIPEDTVLEADAYLVFTRNALDSFTFDFAADGEAALFDGDGVLVESTDWEAGDGSSPSSWGRMPNGTGAFQDIAAPSQGAENL